MRRALVGGCIVWGLMATASPGLAASVRNIYFSNGQVLPGQQYRSEGQLPGPMTTFVKGRDKTARLFIIFGDMDAHRLQGELKAADGKVVGRVDRTIEAYRLAANWRLATHGFDLEKLRPGAYTLDLKIDGEAKGTYTFSLGEP
jgi:hypothetical protein